jgi:hypothetical protein
MPQIFNYIYRFERELGKGSSGTVFLASEDFWQRQVAIKQLENQDADRQLEIVHQLQMVYRLPV